MTTRDTTLARLLCASLLVFGCSSGTPRESTEALQQAAKICPTGYANCNGLKKDHCETYLMTNVSNCGACGNACSFANASPACVDGACVMGSCDAGWADCDGNPANGCETNLAGDVSHCGACGNVCT